MGYLNNGKIIKWLGLEPIQIPKITVELIKAPFETQPIDYSKIDKMECIKVGTHIKQFNQLY